ncbi:hypothetical protein ACFFRR_008689 [Megaselia abdita]
MSDSLRFDKREKHRIFNTLASVPVALIGHAVLIELHNLRSVAGRIVTVDGFTNIELEEVVLIDKTGKQFEFDHFLLKSESIKQIFLPEDFQEQEYLDVNATLLKRSQEARQRMRAKNTKKTERAEARHKETLQEIAVQKGILKKD